VTTCLLSILGVAIGRSSAQNTRTRRRCRGVVLIGIGLKILLEHLGVFA
jgi:putative Mn2+ efflux pump MntP